ncbi:MAG TPA: thioesterase family protein [Bryobacteraceae bacterium]
MSRTEHDHLTGYPVVVTLPVQWGDQDSFRHVNNTVYLRWCETARVDYLIRIGLWGDRPDGAAPIVASLNCDYRRPLNHPDRVLVGARVTRIGNSSFRMEHRIVSESLGVLAAESHSTIVVIDSESGRPVRVPEAIRKAIEQVEARQFEHAGG